MDIGRLQQIIEQVPNQGILLSLPETIRIGCSLKLLQNQVRSEAMFFFGKILAIQADYYIAFSTEHNRYYPSMFFCSTNCIDWFSITKVEDSLREEAIHIREPFTGKLISEFELPSGRLVTEEQRLAAILDTLLHDCLLFPRSYLIQTALNFVIPNPLWSGIPLEESNKLSQFRHWVQRETPPTLLEKALSNPALDFTLPLNDLNGWRFVQTTNLDEVQLRSVHWPGFLFSLCGTEFSNCYFGHGIYEGDLFEPDEVEETVENPEQ